MSAGNFDNPLTAAEASHYASVLRQLLDALDGEIVTAALIRDGQADLLDAERQEVDRVREFLDGRVCMVAEPSDLRGSGLAVLDAFAGEVEAAAEVHHSTTVDAAKDLHSQNGRTDRAVTI